MMSLNILNACYNLPSRFSNTQCFCMYLISRFQNCIDFILNYWIVHWIIKSLSELCWYLEQFKSRFWNNMFIVHWSDLFYSHMIIPSPPYPPPPPISLSDPPDALIENSTRVIIHPYLMFLLCIFQIGQSAFIIKVRCTLKFCTFKIICSIASVRLIRLKTSG